MRRRQDLRGARLMAAQYACSISRLRANSVGVPSGKFQCWAYRATRGRVRFSPLPPMRMGGYGCCRHLGSQ